MVLSSSPEVSRVMRSAASRIDVLSRMIDLRRLPSFKAAELQVELAGPGWKRNALAEDRILEICELAFVLNADGFPVPEIFKRIGRVHSPKPHLSEHCHDPIRECVIQNLRVHEPAYIQLGNDLLNSALMIASLWAEIYAARVARSNWPPPDMLRQPGSILGYAGIMREGDIEKAEWPVFSGSLDDLDVLLKEYRFDAARDVRRMKARAIPGDELRGYDTGGLSWQAMMGSSGIALVRAGLSIDHVETMMS